MRQGGTGHRSAPPAGMATNPDGDSAPDGAPDDDTGAVVVAPKASTLPVAATVDAPSVAGRRHRWRWDVLGLLWTVAAAVVVLAPALRPGISLGPFDLLSRFGLTFQSGVKVHNSVQADQIQQFVPWTDMAWHQIRSGHLPLWDPDNVLGMPLAFNWQSGVFSLPALVSYLFPVRYAYTVVVLLKLVAAGTGAYTLCRFIGTGPLAAAFGGTAFELSGPMIDHAGWPHTAVTCWAGWILAAVLGLLGGRRRTGYLVLLAVAVALAVYGGHPESLVVTAVSVALFLLVFLVVRARTGGGALARPLLDVGLGTAAGAGLGAPLLFPGVQLALLSSRRSGTGAPAFPLTHVPNLLASGFEGGDFKTAAYVGVVVLALAAVGVGVAWRRPAVAALGAVVVATAMLTFLSPVDGLLHRFPGAKTVAWSRAVMLLALALAVLGAIGLDTLVKPMKDLAPLRLATWSFAVLGVGVLGLEVLGRIGLASAINRHQSSLAWPAAQVVVGTALTGLWWRATRAGTRAAHSIGGGSRTPWRAVPVALLALETAFLLSAGIPSWSVSSTYFAPTPAVSQLQRMVGSSLVGFGRCSALKYNTASRAEVGIRPNANIGYGVHEMAVYDPIVPDAYYHAWYALTGQHALPSLAQLGVYCPRITTAAQAQVFGVQYVLEPADRLGPSGTAFVGDAGRESVWRVPDSATATADPIPADGRPLPTEAAGTPLAASQPGPSSWRVVVDQPTASIVRLRITAVPGWHATIDGRPLALSTWATKSMLQARVPPGHHVIELHYWPDAFDAGLVAALAAAVLLVLGGALALVRHRGHRVATTR